MDDSLHLEVAEFEHDVLTGIYSEETGKPQPLRFTINARMKPLARYSPRHHARCVEELHGSEIRRV